MPDEAQDLASHFEGVLDKEEAPERAPRAAKREREDEPEDLFPQREMEGDPNEEDEDGPRREVDPDDEDPDDGPEKDPNEEEDEEETALDLNQVVRLNVDGQPTEVSLQEAFNGYIRTETFHRRLNQVSQVAQEVEKERAQVAELRQYYLGVIPALQQQLASLQPEEPNWDKLYEENPVEAARLERQWRAYREKLGQMQREQQLTQQEAEQERLRKEAIYEDTQRRKLAQMIPEWSDGKKWERDRKSMIRTAMSVGYSEEELGGLKDARATLLLSYADKYLRLMANKPKPVRQQGALRPGAISSRAAPNGVARAERRLQRTGNVRDAARAFEEDLNREG